jgi:hypothetical protein
MSLTSAKNFKHSWSKRTFSPIQSTNLIGKKRALSCFFARIVEVSLTKERFWEIPIHTSQLWIVTVTHKWKNSKQNRFLSAHPSWSLRRNKPASFLSWTKARWKCPQSRSRTLWLLKVVKTKHWGWNHSTSTTGTNLSFQLANHGSTSISKTGIDSASLCSKNP